MPGNALEISDRGDAAEIEGVLAEAFVAGFVSLDLLYTGERVLDGGARAQAGTTRRVLLSGPERSRKASCGCRAIYFVGDCCSEPCTPRGTRARAGLKRRRVVHQSYVI